MSEAGRGVDALDLVYTGGSSNTDPAASLGGAPSTTKLRGLGTLLTSPISAIRIDQARMGQLSEGTGSLKTNEDGDLLYTPPGGSVGSAVAIAADESKVVSGSDGEAGLRVFRESGLPYPNNRTCTITAVTMLHGALSHGPVSDLERQAGVTTYRAIMLYAQGDYEVINVNLWCPAVAGAQATYSLALEEPDSAGEIQTIANQWTEPSGVSWSTPTSEGTALELGTIDAGFYYGLWIRRVFPSSGTVSAKEDFQLHIRYDGA